MAALLSKSLLLLTAFTSITSAAPLEQRHKAATGKAVYFITNDAENAVVALPIGKDGMLSAGTVTKTGGAGSNSIDGMTMMAAVPDALVGQSALTVVGNVRSISALIPSFSFANRQANIKPRTSSP
jgi:hypothetical protein